MYAYHWILILPAIVLTAAYVIKPVQWLKWICIFVLVVTHGGIGFVQNEAESRTLMSQRIRENRWSEDYRDGWSEMLVVARQGFSLTWVPVLGLIAVVLFMRRPNTN
jgi:hypothetical protein